MANRWKNKKTFAACCAFVGLALGVSCAFAPPVQAVVFDSVTSAAASDYLINNGETYWQASNGPTGTLPLIAGQEVVEGSEGSLFHLTGESTFDSQSRLDTRDIIQYSSLKKASSNKTGIISDSGSMTGMGMPIDTSSQCYVGVNQTATNEFFSQRYDGIADNLKFDSGMNIIQLDSDIPDTLEIQHSATGQNGFGTITSSAISKVGYDFSNRTAWTHLYDQRITAGGKTFSIGKLTTFRSFRNLFNSTFEPGEA